MPLSQLHSIITVHTFNSSWITNPSLRGSAATSYLPGIPSRDHHLQGFLLHVPDLTARFCMHCLGEVCLEVVTMNMSSVVPSKPRVMVHFVLPRERALRSPIQQMGRLQLSGCASQYFKSLGHISKIMAISVTCCLLPWLTFQPWIWDSYVPPKVSKLLPHSTTCLKIALFI
jgi:hypothetical protein